MRPSLRPPPAPPPARPPGPPQFRFASGLSVWHGGQLQDEVEQGQWIIAAGSPDWVLGAHPPPAAGSDTPGK